MVVSLTRIETIIGDVLRRLLTNGVDYLIVVFQKYSSHFYIYDTNFLENLDSKSKDIIVKWSLLGK